MKFSFSRKPILLAVALLYFGIATFAQAISLNMSNVTVKQAMNGLKNQTGYSFVYSAGDISTSKRISVDAKTLNDAISQILAGQNVSFEIQGKNIVVSKKKFDEQQDESKRLVGIVHDSHGEPLAGVNIIEKGNPHNGTITDSEGKFFLSYPSTSEIECSFIGFKRKTVDVSGLSSIEIVLEEDTEVLDDVVVIGYGVQKRTNLSGAVSRATSEVLEDKPSQNIISALQGEIPGLLVQRSSGEPGNEYFELNVRGVSSTNGGNSPLVLIDGIPGDLNLLNPQDVSQISVLKDAAASIYGARAAGGVILITTKKGARGKPVVSYSGNVSLTKTTGLMEKPNAYELAIMDNEANIHNGAAPIYSNDYLQRIKNNDPNPIDHPTLAGYKLFFTNSDWLGEIIEHGFIHKHNLSITGGGDNSNYYVSFGYSKQYGAIKYADDNNERYNFRMNYDYQLTDWLRLNSKVSFDDNKRTNIGGVGSWIIGEAMFDMPNFAIYNSQGNYFAQGGWSNAVAWAKEGATATYKTRELNANFEAVVNILKNLTFNGQVGIRYSHNDDEDIANAIPLYNWDNEIVYYGIASSPETAYATRTSGELLYQNYTGYLSYVNSFGDHNLNLMAGLSYEKERTDDFYASRDHFLTSNLWNLNLGGTENMSNGASAEHWAIASFFSRIGYNYRQKYIVEANLRYDGSSRFESGDRYRLFPGISASWRISQEDFMKNLSWLNEMKIRASYGETGNQEGIGLYDYIQLLNVSDAVYPFGSGSKTQSVEMSTLAGVGRSWEILKNTNLGVDLGFLDNRLGLSFDYFWKENDNMLIPVTYPSILGASAPDSNSGKLKTRGFELTLNWNDKIGDDFAYSVKFQLSDAKNKLIDYGGADTYNLGLNSVREGYPINSYFAYVFDGLIRSQAELDEYKKLVGVPSDLGIGDAKFKDLNNDGQISPYGDNDDGDAIYAGNSNPRFTYGLNLNVQWKDFDLGVFFQGVGRRTIFREGDFAMPWSDWWRCPPRFYYLKTWNEDRQDAYYPRLTYSDVRKWNYQASTLQKIDASYIRLKNLQIGYSLPKSLLQKVKLERVRVYLSGQDLFEIHDVDGGWDPESTNSGFNYPFQRYYSMGLDITF